MTRYKRTIYIGIGGAGINTLKFVKAKLTQAVKNESGKNELPKQIQFLCVDTNTTDLANLTEFTDDEKICVSVRDPYGRYDRERTSSTFEFIPEKNTQHILALDRGAGQVRSNGHFAIIESEFHNTLTRKLRTIANNIREVTIPGETMLVDTKIEVHMVFSLCGGTGSGMFLPFSALVREAIKNSEITGYMYSPTFFEHVVEDSARNMVVQNAYAAIAELDYCMHFGSDCHIPLTYSFGPTRNDKITLKNRPFNEVMLIDKQTFAGVNGEMEYTYLKVEEAQELTAELLLLSATDALTAHIGVMDNVRQKVAQGQFNVRDKFGWVMGFGLSELYIKGGDILEKSAIEKVIQYFSGYNKKSDDFNPEPIAYQWLKDLRLNETGDAEDSNALVDDIFKLDSKLRDFNLDELSKNPSKDEWYKMLVKGIDDSIYENRKQELKDKISDNLENYSFSELNEILNELSKLLTKSRVQLESEMLGHKNNADKIEEIDYSNRPQREIIRTNFLGIKRKAIDEDFGTKNIIFTKQQEDAIYDYAAYQLDYDRKKTASKILQDLKGYVDRESNNFLTRSEKVTSFVAYCNDKLKPYINNNDGSNAPKARNRIDVTSSINGFVVDNPFKADIIIAKIDENTCSNSTIFEYAKGLILDAMRGRSENSGKSQLSSIIDGLRIDSSELKELLKNSAPLLSMDFHGESLSVDEFIYVVGESTVANSLKEKLEKMYPKRIEVIPLESMPYSVMVYRIVGAVPPYFVNGIADSTDPLSMEHTYEVMKTKNMTYTPYSHTMLQKMLENRYAVLKPYNELEDGKVMDAWINFILLGLIQRSNSGRYWIQSDSCGERLSDKLETPEKILMLGDDRSSSFEMFRRHCSDLLEEYSTRYSDALEKITRESQKDNKQAIIVDGKPNITSDYFFSKDENIAEDQRGRSLTSRYERDKLRPGDVDFSQFEKEIAHINRRAQEYETQAKAKSLDDEILIQNSVLKSKE